MNFNGHIWIGGLITIILMLVINIITAIKNKMFAQEIFTSYFDFTSFDFWVLAIPIIFLYSILPDIDHQKSIATLISYSFGVIFIALGFMGKGVLEISQYVNGDGLIIYGVVVILATLFFSAYTKHRGVTHTLQFAILSTILLYVVGIQYIIYYIIAFISFWNHLLLDKIPFKVSFKPSNSHI